MDPLIVDGDHNEFDSDSLGVPYVPKKFVDDVIYEISEQDIVINDSIQIATATNVQIKNVVSESEPYGSDADGRTKHLQEHLLGNTWKKQTKPLSATLKRPYSQVNKRYYFNMPATTLHRLVLIAGFISLFHAAYSAAQHRSYLRLNELEFTSLPVDILVQGVVSLFIIMYGVLYIAGDFKEIKAAADLENKTWETYKNIPSFYTFNHRGKAFSPQYTRQTSKLHIEEVE
ncbi:hypothetical protein FQA39_LY06797 [Lamprigera yunnana]|nr:hypothetical protein FQA39_LY06797 [Lamprigera yunnana]